jgi:hypothetical protein
VKIISLCISYSEEPEVRECFITIAFHVAFEYAIGGGVQENNKALELNGMN